MSHVRAIEDLFGELIELESPEERQQYLDRVGSDDPRLRAQLERLVADHERAGSFLQVSEPAAATEELFSSHCPGAQIGPYKLREQIGEGGMGTVYVAEQQQPLRRKVALKVIKPGMDSKAVIARFEAERNALALMDHPNIAKVLDAGTTEQGRPYFVMELVKGIPVTEYCDEHKLTIRERLQLFVTICQAIQHAHQKGIIHRDIKPSNVLITELDGKPIPKVIDFGVAKALNQTLTERSIYTSFQAVIGTPLYMSPEQASLSAVDVDTRSDVYSLGVLLYELLTGTTPFDLQELKKVAQDQVLRFIREQEPPRPSNRLSTLGDTATRISQARRTQPDQLGRQVKGDLDWIVMRALEKERARRYKTADALATDIERHLGNEPVEARPPSTGYRFRKFAARNKSLLVTTFTMLLMLIGGAAAVGWFAYSSYLAGEKLKDLILDGAVADVVGQDTMRSSIAIKEICEAGISDEWILALEAQQSLDTAASDSVIDRLEDWLESDPNSVLILSQVATHYSRTPFLDKYEHYVAKLDDLVVHDPLERLFLAQAITRKDPQRAISLLNEAIKERTSSGLLLLRGSAHLRLGWDTGSREYFEQAFEDATSAERTVGNTPLGDWTIIDSGLQLRRLAMASGETSNRLEEEVRESARSLLRFQDYYIRHLIRAYVFEELGEEGAAEREYRLALECGPYYGIAASVCASYWFAKGELDLAESTVRGEGSPEATLIRAIVLGERGQLDEARKLCEKVRGDHNTGLDAEMMHALLSPAVEMKELVADELPTDVRERSEALFRLAVRYLKNGERPTARAKLDQCLDRYAPTSSYYWARAFARKLDDDKTWPHWIP